MTLPTPPRASGPQGTAWVMAFPVVGIEAIVRTTHPEITAKVNDFRDQATSEADRDRLQELYWTTHSRAMHRLQDRDTSHSTAEWTAFCEDIVTLSVLRYILHREPVAVATGTHMPSDDPDQAHCCHQRAGLFWGSGYRL